MIFSWLDFYRSSASSLFAPKKLVPLPEYIFSSQPLWAKNFLKAAINASDVKSVTTSKCTALVATVA